MKSTTTPTHRQISRLAAAEIIAAFFGSQHETYNYKVSVDEFDEHDNEGPGHYYGVSVPADMADRWDAGLIACRDAGVGASTPEGFALRLTLMYPDGVPSHAAMAIHSYFERKVAEREKTIAPYRATIEAVKGARKMLAELFPAGIRPLTAEEWEAARAARSSWVLMIDNPTDGKPSWEWPQPARELFVAQCGYYGDRLPAMPGNEEGTLGYDAIYRWDGKYLVYSHDAGFQGIEVRL